MTAQIKQLNKKWCNITEICEHVTPNSNRKAVISNTKFPFLLLVLVSSSGLKSEVLDQRASSNKPWYLAFMAYVANTKKTKKENMECSTPLVCYMYERTKM